MQAALLVGINEMENRKTTTANNVYEAQYSGGCYDILTVGGN